MSKKNAEKGSAGLAVFETGGKQYAVSPGDTVTVEKLSENPAQDAEVVFDKVLLMEENGVTNVGAPYIAGAVVRAVVMGAGKGKKIMVIRYKAKSRYFKKRGHRQPYHRLKVSSIQIS